MATIRIPKRSPSLDMTPMVDLGFLLVTFFMLTTVFRPDEPASVNTPSSVSDFKLPERNVILITVDKSGKVYYSFDGQNERIAVLDQMSHQYNIQLNKEEKERFAKITSFGVPMSQIKQFLAYESPESRKQFVQPGIPCDSLRNELKVWIDKCLSINKSYTIAVKGDGEVQYPTMSRVISTLQQLHRNKFNLITSLETRPF